MDEHPRCTSSEDLLTDCHRLLDGVRSLQMTTRFALTVCLDELEASSYKVNAVIADMPEGEAGALRRAQHLLMARISEARRLLRVECTEQGHAAANSNVVRFPRSLKRSGLGVTW
jgi:hypothetical protein